MRLLVVGANGFVGSNVVAAGMDAGWSVAGTYHLERPSFDVDLSQLDVRDGEQFADLLDRVTPDAVVNCAAMTGVDACEDDEGAAFAVNGAAPAAMATACADRSIAFCHLSTDYVFDGRSDVPYVKDDPSNPIQTYGESKLAGEHRVRKAHPYPLVCRLSFVYGVHAGRGELLGFPRCVRNRLRDEQETLLFVDQFVSTARAGHAAETVLALLDPDATGTFHVAARKYVTPHEFGRAVARRIGVGGTDLLKEGSQDDVDGAANRPRNSCLDVSRIESTLGRPQLTIEADLDAITETF